LKNENTAKNSVSHPEIVNSIVNGLWNEDFIEDLYKNLELNAITIEKAKEKQLKISVLKTIIGKIDSWLPHGEEKDPINPCISTEFSLPCIYLKDTEEIHPQYFTWFKNKPKRFLPPTDIVINPTGWVPDPVFGYSLSLGIELKIITDYSLAELLVKDIKKGMYYLLWCRPTYLSYMNTPVNVYHQHITENASPLETNFYFFFIWYFLNSDYSVETIKDLFARVDNKIAVDIKCAKAGNLYLCRMKMT